MPGNSHQTPVLLLKTQSGPTDAYRELFSTPRDGFDFEPTFVPVLQHQFEEAGLKTVRELLRGRRINRSQDAAFGGLIFTSQRAVEAFGKLVDGGQGDESWPHLQDVPFYSVGPATTRALKAIHQSPPLQIFGEHTGNGDALAHFILEHYGEWYSDRPAKPPLLFLVGEQRRDIIPKTLTNLDLAADKRIDVTEIVVYGTGVMESFFMDFKEVLRQTSDRTIRWVVVFSPTGCDSMLRGLDMLGEGGQIGDLPHQRSTFIATIGPTTRDYLKRTFGYEPDVCAEKPTPEGVWEGITRFNVQSN
ncbi:uroporphyrinogen-III synthase [Apiospora saccharicola]|uniref:Uroporphyrinogen-III synthase n=1 Tax=Apiospora saccharicola TaxID=335842 RepID=A0ABR1U3A3_9PEZI